MKTSGAGHPRPVLDIAIRRKSERKYWVISLVPTPARPPHCIPYLSHKSWDKQWCVKPKAGLGVYRGKAWEPSGMKKGNRGFWAGSEGSPGCSGACPGDCPQPRGQGWGSFWGLNSCACPRFSPAQSSSPRRTFSLGQIRKASCCFIQAKGEDALSPPSLWDVACRGEVNAVGLVRSDIPCHLHPPIKCNRTQPYYPHTETLF